MGSFFRKDEEGKPKLEGKDSSVSSEELLSTSDDNTRDEEVITDLSIHPEWSIPKEDEYAYRFLNMECLPLKPNQVSISGISIMEQGPGNYRVNAFIRNSLDKVVSFEPMKLVLLDENNTLLGRKFFDLDKIGDIPPKSSRPWFFEFSSKDLFKKDLPKEGWTLAFWIEADINKHKLDIDKSWENALATGAKDAMVKFFKSINPPNKDELNFQSVDAVIDDSGELQITILIRNGKEDNIKFEEIPLVVEDASGDIVAKGHFTLDNFIVKANTSKPWTFIFPKQNQVKDKPNFTKWKAYIPS